MPDDFARFGGLHAIVVAASAAAIAFLVMAGRVARARSERRERALRIAWTAGLVLLQGFTQLWSNLPPRFDAARSLPLHICDLVPWIGIAALVAPRSGAAPLAYYWGIGLSGWAFVIPVLTHGPAHLSFWLFFLGHLQIVGTAAYLVLVLGHRPTTRGLAVAAGATLLYTAAMLPIDLALDADYGYLGRRSAAEPLGPWPERVALLVAIEIAIFALLWLPWRRSSDPHALPDET